VLSQSEGGGIPRSKEEIKGNPYSCPQLVKTKWTINNDAPVASANNPAPPAASKATSAHAPVTNEQFEWKVKSIWSKFKQDPSIINELLLSVDEISGQQELCHINLLRMDYKWLKQPPQTVKKLSIEHKLQWIESVRLAIILFDRYSVTQFQSFCPEQNAIAKWLVKGPPKDTVSWESIHCRRAFRKKKTTYIYVFCCFDSSQVSALALLSAVGQF
jgi:hypothetical protein